MLIKERLRWLETAGDAFGVSCSPGEPFIKMGMDSTGRTDGDGIESPSAGAEGLSEGLDDRGESILGAYR